ncbi:hypothetical protein KFK09_028940 [Dendrobium nobile]|uniref:Mitochondrial protein n=1 Tax=Dendrobium nobile TaxID=94219 RepID=A0A8T3A4T9_DENNO|nr:hypothetical protein KFK09_028940 [Dendrobium nobile]
MADCKSISKPTTAKPDTTPEASIAFSDPYFYRHLVGSLQYFTIMRPDLSFAVNRICQHMHDPQNQHFTMLK